MSIAKIAEKIFKKKNSITTPEYRSALGCALKRPMQNGEWFQLFKQMRKKGLANLRKSKNSWFIERD